LHDGRRRIDVVASPDDEVRLLRPCLMPQLLRVAHQLAGIAQAKAEADPHQHHAEAPKDLEEDQDGAHDRAVEECPSWIRPVECKRQYHSDDDAQPHHAIQALAVLLVPLCTDC